jgi:hypothetical protein
METAADLLRQGRSSEIWQEYCGFIDLSLPEFMQIHKRLLMEQIHVLSQCELGRRLLGGRTPANVEEFRENVPLTIYADYVPELMEKQEDVLPEKPYMWARTSGRSGEYEAKWVPFSRRLFMKYNAYAFATFLFGASDRRGEFTLEEGDVILATLAPLPYLSGLVARGVVEHFPLRYIPPLEEAEKMEFQDRIMEGFRLALVEGIDVFYGLGSVLVKIGEQFEQASGTTSIDKAMLLNPRVMLRIAKGLIKSRLARRPMLPKDLWSIKTIAAGGTDIELCRDKIRYYWGRTPSEGYGGTESGAISLQTWGTSLTFTPDMGFWEFIPEREHLRSREDPAYEPSTLLLDEVEVGEIYEMVITNFHGGPFVRYRVGDLIRITGLRDDQHNIDIPQMVFHSRADDVIDLGGFTRLTQKTIAHALANADIDHADWTATRETEGERSMLHLHIETTAREQRDAQAIAEALHQSLKDLEPEYRDWERVLGGEAPIVTVLSAGTFARYTQEKQAAGVDLAKLKPARMKPSDVVVGDLLRLSEQPTIQ